MSNRTTKPPENQDLKRMVNSLPMVVGNLLNSGIPIIGIRGEFQTARELSIQVTGDMGKLIKWAEPKELEYKTVLHTLSDRTHFWTLDYTWRHIKVFKVLYDDEKEALESASV